MAGEDSRPLDDPAPRPVAVTWVWPGRWLLVVGTDVATVLSGAELGMLAGEVNREAGRRGGGGDGGDGAGRGA